MSIITLFEDMNTSKSAFEAFSKDPISALTSAGIPPDQAMALLSSDLENVPEALRPLASRWLSALVEAGASVTGIGGISGKLAEAVRVVATNGGNVDELARQAKELGFQVEVS